MSIPRPEHPQPQFFRPTWLNLNGTWTFDFDFGKSGLERGLHRATALPHAITVPFCPEAALSGVAHTDFIEAMFYQRNVTVPAEWQGLPRILLHFGAVDYHAQIYVNGELVCRHSGGSTPFTADLTGRVQAGQTFSLTVAVQDNTRSGAQGVGKQSMPYASAGCSYTRVTGIWQTVYLEATQDLALVACRCVPDFDGSRFVLTPTFTREQRGAALTVTAKADGAAVASRTVPAVSGVPVALDIPAARPWSPDSPFLYDLEYTVTRPDGSEADRVQSYAGLRKISVEGNRILLNNRPIFLRMVLDQGFYPDGIWTAPSAQALENDIRLSMACGFNAARLHQKVFEPLFHYYADKLGYLTWAEYPSWGMACNGNTSSPAYFESEAHYLREWRACVERDANHPSIIAWSPLNETAPNDRTPAHTLACYQRFVSDIYDLTHAIDPTRPVNDSSGWTHVKTDIWTTHNYCPDANALRKSFEAEGKGTVARNRPAVEPPYAGQPFVCDEWGGFKFIPADRRDATQAGWGYHGLVIDTPQQLLDKIAEQIDVLVSWPDCCGYCYTQLTDVEQEQNGVLCYDRTPKAPLDQYAKLFGRTRNDL